MAHGFIFWSFVHSVVLLCASFTLYILYTHFFAVAFFLFLGLLSLNFQSIKNFLDHLTHFLTLYTTQHSLFSDTFSTLCLLFLGLLSEHFQSIWCNTFLVTSGSPFTLSTPLLCTHYFPGRAWQDPQLSWHSLHAEATLKMMAIFHVHNYSQ